MAHIRKVGEMHNVIIKVMQNLNLMSNDDGVCSGQGEFTEFSLRLGRSDAIEKRYGLIYDLADIIVKTRCQFMAERNIVEDKPSQKTFEKLTKDDMDLFHIQMEQAILDEMIKLEFADNKVAAKELYIDMMAYLNGVEIVQLHRLFRATFMKGELRRTSRMQALITPVELEKHEARVIVPISMVLSENPKNELIAFFTRFQNTLSTSLKNHVIIRFENLTHTFSGEYDPPTSKNVGLFFVNEPNASRSNHCKSLNYFANRIHTGCNKALPLTIGISFKVCGEDAPAMRGFIKAEQDRIFGQNNLERFADDIEVMEDDINAWALMACDIGDEESLETILDAYVDVLNQIRACPESERQKLIDEHPHLVQTKNLHELIVRVYDYNQPKLLSILFDYAEKVLLLDIKKELSPYIRVAVSNGPFSLLAITLKLLYPEINPLDNLSRSLARLSIKDEDHQLFIALHFAVNKNDFDMVKRLLAYGASLYKILNKLSLIEAAIDASQTDVLILRHLMEMIPNHHAANNLTGAVPLHRAAQNRDSNLALTELLKTATPENIDAKELNNYTALHVAVINGNTAAAKALIAKGANVNAISNTNDTPLHYACRNGKKGIIIELLKHAADSTIRNNANETARDIVKEMHPKLTVLFLDSPAAREGLLKFSSFTSDTSRITGRSKKRIAAARRLGNL